MIRGFYAVLDRDDIELARTLVRHATVLQVRLKPASTSEIVRVARMARRVCDEVGAKLVVNDRVDIALAVGADGVHLGQTDLPLRDVRAIAPGLIIGVSTHNPDQVRAAVLDGADYLGFGPMYPTRTKQNPDPVQGIAGLRAAALVAGDCPIVAIGGINPERADEVYAAGAAAICAIGAVNDAIDVTAAARALSGAQRLHRHPDRG